MEDPSLINDADEGSVRTLDDFSIPIASYDLIRLLDKAHPHRCPPRSVSQEDILRYAGARELIDDLLIVMEEEQTREQSDGSSL